MEIKEYEEKFLEGFKILFSELQTFEKAIWPGRAKATPKFMDRLTNDLLTDVNNKNGKVYLAYDGQMPVGFIAGYVTRDLENDADYFRIDSLVVTEKYRGSGVGKKLMEKVEEYSKSIGQTKMGLGVLVGNKKAYEYYKKLGFRNYSIEMLKDL